MKKTLFLILSIIVLSDNIFAQKNPDDGAEHYNNYKTVFPPEPNLYSFATQGNHQVNLFKGVPEISIPLWTVKSGDITIPLAISYNAQGVKLQDIPSWVGANWSFVPGGVITRTVRNRRDELPNGYYNMGTLTYPNTTYSNLSNILLSYERILNGLDKDCEPDEFYLNFHGYSGSFYFKLNKEVVIDPYQKMKITPTIENNNITSFKVTTSNGFVYYFNAAEELEIRTYPNTDIKKYNNAWYLSKIVSPIGNYAEFEYYNDCDIIANRNFSETYKKYIYKQVIYNEISNHDPSLISYNNLLSVRKIPIIKEIRTNNQTISFLLDTRQDVLKLSFDVFQYPNIRARSLSAMNIYDKTTDKQVKSYKFYYNNSLNRLFLDSLQEISIDNDTIPPYKFNYYRPDELLSPSNVFYQDHWGYFSQKAGEETQLPVVCVKTNLGNYKELSYEECYRSTDTNTVKIGILNKITYPTGGYTDFFYEPNEVDNFKANLDYYYKHIDRGKTIRQSIKYCVCNNNPSISFDLLNKNISSCYLSIKLNAVCGSDGDQDIDMREGDNSDDNNYTVYVNNHKTEGKGDKIDKIDVDNLHTSSINHRNNLSISMNSNIQAKAVLTLTFSDNGSGNDIGENSIFEKYVGGLRIKQIIDYNVDSSIILNRLFDYSGGKIFGLPSYFHIEQTDIWGTNNKILVTYYYGVISSINSSVDKTIKGTHVGYSNIEVNKIDNLGHTIKEITEFYNISDNLTNPDYPSLPVTNFNKEIGNIKSKKIYREDRIVMQKDYEYGYIGNIDTGGLVKGYVIGRHGTIDLAHSSNIDLITLPYSVNNYNRTSSLTAVTREKTTEFTDNGKFISTTDYEYNKYGFVKKIIVNDSTDCKITTEKYYPFDNSDADVPSKMTELMMLSPVVQVKKYMNSVLTENNIVNFHYIKNKFVLPYSVKEFNIKTNIFEKIYSFDKYNEAGKLVEFHEFDGIPVAVIWGYHNTKPVAKIENAHAEDVNAILENADLMIIDNPPNEFKLRETIDKIRNNQKMTNANVYTYTYNIYGVTSSTDPNGKTNYYKYDALGRLKTTFDHNNKITKYIEYGYFNIFK